MITDIPHKLWLYLGWKNTFKLQKGVISHHYLSWEDAFWDILEVKKIPKGAICLVPEFFCWDVVKNMQTHGLRIETYPVDKYVRSSTKSFVAKVNKHQPQIIIIFHAVGIQNSLLSTIKLLNSKTIIIEDSVHLLINPREVKLLGNNHFIIDSWRKVIPLQGSALYTTKSFKASKQSNFYKTLPYQIYVIFLWFLMELFSLFNLDLTAQKLMQRGYDTIGDNLISAPLFPLFSFLHKYIDYQKVRTKKYTNMRLYDNYFKVHKLDKKVFFNVKFTEKDWIQMRGYPVGLQLKFADHVLKKLRNKGFLARFELNDSPWSKKQKIIYLPINPEINVEDVIKLLNDSLYEEQKANIF